MAEGRVAFRRTSSAPASGGPHAVSSRRAPSSARSRGRPDVVEKEMYRVHHDEALTCARGDRRPPRRASAYVEHGVHTRSRSALVLHGSRCSAASERRRAAPAILPARAEAAAIPAPAATRALRHARRVLAGHRRAGVEVIVNSWSGPETRCKVQGALSARSAARQDLATRSARLGTNPCALEE